MNLEPGLTIISTVDADQVVTAAAEQGVPLYHLSTGDRSGREPFFDTVRDTFPLNPPIVSYRSWDALSDSLWEGIHSLEVGRLVILWSDATVMAEQSPADYAVAIDVLADVARLLADEDATVGRPTEVCAYVGVRR